jgi:hypothetical protein
MQGSKSMDGSIRFPDKVTKAKKKPAKKGEYKPRTQLVRELMEIRQKAIAEGMKLLSVDEVLEETRQRRGPHPYDEY